MTDETRQGVVGADWATRAFRACNAVSLTLSLTTIVLSFILIRFLDTFLGDATLQEWAAGWLHVLIKLDFAVFYLSFISVAAAVVFITIDLELIAAIAVVAVVLGIAIGVAFFVGSIRKKVGKGRELHEAIPHVDESAQTLTAIRIEPETSGVQANVDGATAAFDLCTEIQGCVSEIDAMLLDVEYRMMICHAAFPAIQANQ